MSEINLRISSQSGLIWSFNGTLVSCNISDLVSRTTANQDMMRRASIHMKQRCSDLPGLHAANTSMMRCMVQCGFRRDQG